MASRSNARKMRRLCSFKRRSATRRRVGSLFRGLKPTATATASLREAESAAGKTQMRYAKEWPQLIVETQSQLVFIGRVNRAPSAKEQKLLDLCEATIGTKLRVRSLNGQTAICQRLREMGFCEYAEIHKVADNGALICQVCGSRVALSRKLAKGIMVQAVQTETPRPES